MTEFAGVLRSWQGFYGLLGTAGATLAGLMFIAVTFGASLVKQATVETSRAFIDPTFTHFVQVLVVGCLMCVPDLGPRELAWGLIAMGVFRTSWLTVIFRRLRAAHRISQDLELEDWLMYVIVPLIAHGLFFLCAGLFYSERFDLAFRAMAIASMIILTVGIYNSWELLVWIALQGAERR